MKRLCRLFAQSMPHHVGGEMMKADFREPQAPESYATFWEPLAGEPATIPPTFDTSTNSREAEDAYSEFVNVTEETPSSLRIERN